MTAAEDPCQGPIDGRALAVAIDGGRRHLPVNKKACDRRVFLLTKIVF